jgi:hypothetical protein
LTVVVNAMTYANDESLIHAPFEDGSGHAATIPSRPLSGRCLGARWMSLSEPLAKSAKNLQARSEAKIQSARTSCGDDRRPLAADVVFIGLDDTAERTGIVFHHVDGTNPGAMCCACDRPANWRCESAGIDGAILSERCGRRSESHPTASGGSNCAPRREPERIASSRRIRASAATPPLVAW